MEIFYAGDIDDNICRLDETESAHCIKVLRHRRGDRISVIDGKGNMMECRLVTDSPRGAEAEILCVAVGKPRKHIYYSQRSINSLYGVRARKRRERCHFRRKQHKQRCSHSGRTARCARNDSVKRHEERQVHQRGYNLRSFSPQGVHVCVSQLQQGEISYRITTSEHKLVSICYFGIYFIVKYM